MAPMSPTCPTPGRSRAHPAPSRARIGGPGAFPGACGRHRGLTNRRHRPGTNHAEKLLMSHSIVPPGPGGGSGRVTARDGAEGSRLHPQGSRGGGGGSEPGGGLVIDVVGVVAPHCHRLRLAEGAAATAGLRAGREGGVRDERGDPRMALSSSVAGPGCPEPRGGVGDAVVALTPRR